MSHLYVVQVFVRFRFGRPVGSPLPYPLQVVVHPLRTLHIVAPSRRRAAEAAHWRIVGWRCAEKLGGFGASTSGAAARDFARRTLKHCGKFSLWYGLRFDFESVNKIVKLYYSVSPAPGCLAVSLRAGHRRLDLVGRARRHRLHARLRFVSPN